MKSMHELFDGSDPELIATESYETNEKIAKALGMSGEREARLLARIQDLEHLANCDRMAIAEARQDERTAMSYLADVRAIVGGDDFPDMVRRVAELVK